MLFQSKYTVQCSLGQSFTGQRIPEERFAVTHRCPGQRSAWLTALSHLCLVDHFFKLIFFTLYFYLFDNLLKTCLLIIICNVGLQYCVDSALSWTARNLTHWCPWQRSALLLGPAESRKMQINLLIQKNLQNRFFSEKWSHLFMQIVVTMYL